MWLSQYSTLSWETRESSSLPIRLARSVDIDLSLPLPQEESVPHGSVLSVALFGFAINYSSDFLPEDVLVHSLLISPYPLPFLVWMSPSSTSNYHFPELLSGQTPLGFASHQEKL